MTEQNDPQALDTDSNIPSKNQAKKRLTAVSLENDRANLLELPKISAAGHGKIAEKILEIAFEQGIKVRKDADLAELLATVELNDEIPTEAVVAVAEILIQVYKANGTLPMNYNPDMNELQQIQDKVQKENEE